MRQYNVYKKVNSKYEYASVVKGQGHEIFDPYSIWVPYAQTEKVSGRKLFRFKIYTFFSCSFFETCPHSLLNEYADTQLQHIVTPLFGLS